MDHKVDTPALNKGGEAYGLYHSQCSKQLQVLCIQVNVSIALLQTYRQTYEEVMMQIKMGL